MFHDIEKITRIRKKHGYRNKNLVLSKKIVEILEKTAENTGIAQGVLVDMALFALLRLTINSDNAPAKKQAVAARAMTEPVHDEPLEF